MWPIVGGFDTGIAIAKCQIFLEDAPNAAQSNAAVAESLQITVQHQTGSMQCSNGNQKAWKSRDSAMAVLKLRLGKVELSCIGASSRQCAHSLDTPEKDKSIVLSKNINPLFFFGGAVRA